MHTIIDSTLSLPCNSPNLLDNSPAPTVLPVPISTDLGDGAVLALNLESTVWDLGALTAAH